MSIKGKNRMTAEILMPTFLTREIFVNCKLDVDPQRDDDASPMSSYRFLLRPT